jgi:tRNA(fMet)-specific endonuclease VapC
VAAKGEAIFVSSIVMFELWHGVAESSRHEANSQRVETFFAGPVSLLSFDADDAAKAGAVRAELEFSGKPIGAYDLLIAGQARQRSFTLVTANVGEFSRIHGLRWQDWAKAS